jgi:hypothetical protein
MGRLGLAEGASRRSPHKRYFGFALNCLLGPHARSVFSSRRKCSKWQPHQTESLNARTEIASLFTLTMKLPPTLGHKPAGWHRVFSVSSGQFIGDRLRRGVLPQVGLDPSLLRQDGSSQQDVRLILLQRVCQHLADFSCVRGRSWAWPPSKACPPKPCETDISHKVA